MATIPLEALNRFTDGINAISGRSADELGAMLSAIDWSQDFAGIRDAAIEAMQICCGGSTDLAAMLAADFYDYARELELGEALGAVADSRRVPEATDGAVRAFVQDIVEGKPREEFERKCRERLDYETKKAAAECVYENGRRDPERPRFARVPTGSETCEFCIMLASRGFVYHTGESAGKDGHYHANCGCRIVPGWKGTEVAGYDPDTYYDMWKHPEDHPELREARNARRRELYLQRKDAEESTSATSRGSIKWPEHTSPITNEEFKVLRQKAADAGITLRGFRRKGFDVKAVELYIDSAAKVLNDHPELAVVDGEPLTFNYTGMHNDDFAYIDPVRTGWNVIHVNRDSIRSLDALETEYEKLQEDGWFVRDTTAESVVFHELGHVYCHVHSIDAKAVVESALNSDGARAKEMLIDGLSEYSSTDASFGEAIPEAFSGYYSNSSENATAKAIMGEVLTYDSR